VLWRIEWISAEVSAPLVTFDAYRRDLNLMQGLAHTRYQAWSSMGPTK
jgi:hypothetical protein